MKETIDATENFVKTQLASSSGCHDWEHVQRVRKLALTIGRAEGADLYIIELAALLHDIDDWKFSDETNGPEKARNWLNSLSTAPGTIAHVCSIIEGISFKGAGVPAILETPEGRIVQDADRLDAIGAVGIARAFTYGGFKGRKIYDPQIKPVLHKSFEEYKKSAGPSLNHFYEKLLLLKDLMNTETAKKMAAKRHEFMLEFLNQFFSEIDDGSE